MSNLLSKMTLGARIVSGVLIVEFISLGSGIAMGMNFTSSWVIFGFIATIVVSQIIAWIVVTNIKTSITEVLTELTKTSENMNMLSGELTNSGRKLAEGSAEQAASIQETSSTLEESASMVHQTTQNTKAAETLARESKLSAERGNDEMKGMLDAMVELKRSSGEISKIIKVIDEIAFQTNILSLNAAVEAARAGDAGKGFAVVAEEVRNLAQRSAEAAKDTAQIIESNIDLSEKCLRISQQVGGSLEEISDGTNKVNELLGEISTASQEQEIGIGQINKAISQMESVLQSNAATANESAESADRLSDFSHFIENIMINLKSIIEGKDTEQISKPISAKTEIKPKRNSFKPEPKKELKRPAKEEKTPKVSKVSAPTMVRPEINKGVNPSDIIPLDEF